VTADQKQAAAASGQQAARQLLVRVLRIPAVSDQVQKMWCYTQHTEDSRTTDQQDGETKRQNANADGVLQNALKS
jgi:hypothetical protein